MNSRAPLLLLLAWALALGGCDSLGLDGEPQQLLLELDASGTDRVALITSTEWVYAPDPACEPGAQGCPEVVRVLAADSADVAVPLRRTLRFTQSRKFFIEVYPRGGVIATVAMRIEIDGKEWYHEARELTPTGDAGAQATLQFVYQWRQPRIP